MQESGALRHIPWKELTSRESEIRGVKHEECYKTDSSGHLKLVSTNMEAQADLSSDSRLRFALQRRGVALQIAEIMSFRAHEEVVNWFTNELERETLPGHSKVTVDQVHRADIEIFTRAAELLKEDLSKREDGSLPLDNVVRKILEEPRIQALLFPYRTSSGSKRESDDEVTRLREEVKRLRAQPGKGKGKAPGKGGAKSKNNKRGDGTRMPKELIGLSTTINGERPCYAFNLEGCSQGVNGKCPKGVHRCMKPGC
eukprot:1820177-Karenia_brevis.AAC.1